mgnify:CR=1 FL=1
MLSKEVVSGNVVLAVETVGERDAPAIVLCQGLGMRVADWPARLIEGLARDFFVVLVENRDTGRSGRAAVPYTLFDMAADIERGAADLCFVGSASSGLGRSTLAVPICTRNCYWSFESSDIGIARQ